MISTIRHFATAWIAVGVGSLSAAEKSPLRPASAVQLTVQRYCADCHDEQLRKGGLDLDGIVSGDIREHSQQWERVVRKLRTRQMPPLDKKHPDEKTYETVLASLEHSLETAAAFKPNPGRTETLRRLNRTEYQNAIRDLLALDIDAASLLPADESGYGFDNVTVGDLPPALLDRYISAAQKISRLAIGSPQSSVQSD